MENRSNFIKKLRFDNRLTQEQLANKLGVTKGYIALVEANRSKLSDKVYNKILELYPTIQKYSEDCVTLERIHINPSCGKGTMVLDEVEVTPITLGKKLIQNVLKVSDINNLKVFKAAGDSMEPTIYDGDDVLVDIGRGDYINGGVFIIEKFGDLFIKRLNLRFDGNLEIISDNKDKYQAQLIKFSEDIEINIKGRVIKNLSRGL